MDPWEAVYLSICVCVLEAAQAGDTERADRLGKLATELDWGCPEHTNLGELVAKKTAALLAESRAGTTSKLIASLPTIPPPGGLGRLARRARS